MSTSANSSPPAHASLRTVAEMLRAAARHYRAAWIGQRLAEDAWQQALEAVTAQYAEGSPPEVAAVLTTFNASAKAAQLLKIDVSDSALKEMEQGARQLEAVAQAAEHLASVLEAQRGVLQ